MKAVQALSALAQPIRLKLFRLLVRHAPQGLCVGDLLKHVDLAQPTLSFHLKELSAAGLLARSKQGRQVFYAPAFSTMDALLGYLTENCCAASPEKGAGCCPPTESSS